MKADNIVAFIVGAAAGVSVAFFVLDKKYRKMYEEDVASVKKAFSKKEEAPKETEEPKPASVKHHLGKEEFDNVLDYAKAVNKYSGKEESDEDYSEDEAAEVEDEEESEPDDIITDVEEKEVRPHVEGYKPSIVSPTAYAEEDYAYSTNTFILFADGIVTDDNYTPLTEEEVEGTIGLDAVNHFDEDEDDPDVVYVRNDEKQAYYELVRDIRDSTDMK